MKESAIILFAALWVASVSAQSYDITWNTIDGGGETFSTGGGFELGGTIGQPDAGAVMTGGGYELSGGFWASSGGGGGGGCPGDLDGDNGVGLSDLATLLAHYGMTSGVVYEDGDLDMDGDVDLADLATMLAVYGTSCSCQGDLDGDNQVGLSDLATLLASYGQPGPWAYEDGDLDGDTDVDLSDLATLLAVYGAPCE